MKLYLLPVMALFCLPISEVRAAPAPTENNNAGRPTVVLRVKSIDDLLGSLKTTMKTFFPESQYKDFEREVLSELDPSKLKGVATNKPFGLYATLGEGLIQRPEDYSKSSAVALIPIADEKAFLELLAMTPFPPEKKGEVYSFPIPDAPIKVSMRFLNGYAYISAASDEIDPKKLLAPKELFAGPEAAALAMRIYPDRVPADLKKAARELFMAIHGVFTDGAPPPNLRIGIGGLEMGFLVLAAPLLVPSIKMVLEDDAKEIVYRLDLDAKTGVFVQEIAVEPAKGSPLARSFGRMPPTKNDFAAIVGADSAVQLLLQTPLFTPEVKDLLSKALDMAAKKAGTEAADHNLPKEARDAVAEGFKALRRSIDDESLDLAASLRGPDKNGQFTAVGALSLKDTAALEKALKDAATIVPQPVKDLIKLDAFKVNGVNVHEIAVGEMLPDERQKVFGKSSVYVALAPNAAFVAFGAQGKAIISETLAGKLGPKPAALLHVDIASKRLVPLFKTLGAPSEAIELIEKLGQTERQAVLAIKVEGGDKLVLRQEIGLAGFFALMPKAAKANAQPAVAPMAVPAPKK